MSVQCEDEALSGNRGMHLTRLVSSLALSLKCLHGMCAEAEFNSEAKGPSVFGEV